MDSDGDINDTELLSYIDQWTQGMVSDTDLLIAINYQAA